MQAGALSFHYSNVSPHHLRLLLPTMRSPSVQPLGGIVTVGPVPPLLDPPLPAVPPVDPPLPELQRPQLSLQ